MDTEIKNGVEFNFRGTVYRIVEMTRPDQTLIASIPVACPGASHLWKPSPMDYQYFSRIHILECMAGGMA